MANEIRDKFGNKVTTETQEPKYTLRFRSSDMTPFTFYPPLPASLKLEDGRTFVPPELLPEPLRFLLREMDRILGRERAEFVFDTAIKNKVISQAFEDGTALSCKAAIIEFRAGLVPENLWGKYPELCKAIDEVWYRWPVMKPIVIGGAYGYDDSFSVSSRQVTRGQELVKFLQAKEKAMTAQMEMQIAVDLGMTVPPAQSSTSQATERSSPPPTLDDVNNVTMEILTRKLDGRPFRFLFSGWKGAPPPSPDLLGEIQEGLNPNWDGTVKPGVARSVSARTPLLPINSKRPKFRAKIDPCTPSGSAPRK